MNEASFWVIVCVVAFALWLAIRLFRDKGEMQRAFDDEMKRLTEGKE